MAEHWRGACALASSFPPPTHLTVNGEYAAVGEQVAGLKTVVRGELGEAGVLPLQELVLTLPLILYSVKNKLWSNMLWGRTVAYSLQHKKK
jgi:hypothetical protein